MTSMGKQEAVAFGDMIRRRRKKLGMRQEDVAFAAGVGRRYLIELEAGKPTAWLGPALMIAHQLGIVPVQQGASPTGARQDLPPLRS